MFDFSNDDFRKIFYAKFEKNFGGTPILAPRRAASSKMTIPPMPLTPLYYFRCLHKTRADPLRFDQDIKVLRSKKKIKNFHFFALRMKNAVNQRFSRFL